MRTGKENVKYLNIQDLNLYTENVNKSRKHTFRTSKSVQQGYRIKDQNTKTNCISVPKQWTI